MEEHGNTGAEQPDPEDRLDWPPVNPQPGIIRRKFWRIGLAILCLILLLRETGLLNLNFYVSSSSVSYLASFSGPPIKKKEDGPTYNYQVQLRQGKAILMDYQDHHEGIPRMKIVAEFDEPVFFGNSWMPFFKNFSMDYRCPVRTVESTAPAGEGWKGEIGGKVEMHITGFCSHHQARALAMGEARKNAENNLRKKIIEGN